MKCKNPVYNLLLAEILRAISMYPGLKANQLCRFRPKQGKIIEVLLANLRQQGRIILSDNGRYYINDEQKSLDRVDYQAAVWVLLDSLDIAEYHTAGEFPITLIFFAKGQLYEVIHIPQGQENLFNELLRLPTRDGGRRLVVVDRIGQEPLIDFPDIVGFCTVDENGIVSYYQREVTSAAT